MAIDMSQFFQIFFEESEEHLATMESLLLELDVAQPDHTTSSSEFKTHTHFSATFSVRL